MSFAIKLREARENKGYTQQQVADLMQIDKSTYCGYEIGKRQPDVLKVKQLCKLLDISGDALLETGFDKEKEKTPEEPELNEGEKLLIQLFRQVPPDRQKLILDTVRAFADQL